jgi:capsular exopolysaccharide synthesis family protein
VDLRYYVRVVRLRWRLIALCVLAAMVPAALVTFTAAPKYTASVQMFVAARDTTTAGNAYNGGLFSQQRVKSYVKLADSQSVMAEVIKRLALPTTPATLAKEVTATVPTDTVIIVLSATDRSPALAQAIANATGDQFGLLVTAVEKTDPAAASPVKVTVFQPATLPTAKSSPKTKINLGIGLLAGLCIGLAAAMLRSRLDTSLKTGDDMAQETSMPTLGVIAFDRAAAARPLLLQADSRSPRAESFRQLRTSLQFVDVDRQPRSIVVTSALPGEGKTTTAANLAITLAEAGLRVVLVDADLRRPRLGGYLGVEASVGLTSVLIGSVDLADALQDWGDRLLRVLASGPIPPNPSELLGSVSMRHVIHALERDSDMVLLDCPPLLPVTDASILSATAGGVIVVVRSGKTKREELKRAVHGLETVGANVLGGVLNMSPRKGPNAEGYYYRYEQTTPKFSRRNSGKAGAGKGGAQPLAASTARVVPAESDRPPQAVAAPKVEAVD